MMLLCCIVTGPVTNLRLVRMDSRQVTFQWSEPEKTSGGLVGYRINYSGSRENRMTHAPEQAIILAKNTTQYQVRDLLPLYKYKFEVRTSYSYK